MTSRPVTRTSSRAEGAEPLHGLLPDPVRSRTVPPPDPPTLVDIQPQEPEPSRVLPGGLLLFAPPPTALQPPAGPVPPTTTPQPPQPPPGNDSLQIVDDMTQVISDQLQQGPVATPGVAPDPDATTTGIQVPQALISGGQQRVITAEAAQQMIKAIGEGLKALQHSLSTEVTATRQTANLVHAQGMQLGTDLNNGLTRVDRDHGILSRNTQKIYDQILIQAGSLTAMDQTLGKTFKNISKDVTKLQQTADLILRDAGSSRDEQSLNESLKAINAVLVSQRTKLDTIEELLQVVEDRGSHTIKDRQDPPARRGWEPSEGRPATPRRESHAPIGIGTPLAESTVIPPERTTRRRASFRRTTSPERSRSPPRKRPSIPKEARARRPDRFSGKKGREAEAFMTKMEAHFADYDDYDIDDERKIRATLSNMAEGKADDWAQPLLQKFTRGEDHEFFQSWETFRKAFLDSFTDPVKKEKAVRELGNLKQTGAAQDYATKFRTLALETNWNEEALVDKFREGLKPEVREELTRMAIYSGSDTDEWTLDNWVIFAGKADDMVYTSHRNSHKKESNQNRNAQTSSTDRGKSAITSNAPKAPNPNVVRIPDEEKKRRRDNGLCLKCAKPGHMIKNCKGKWTLEPTTNSGTVKGKAAKTPSEYSSDSENE
ncbi:hypothetical protein FRC08_014400 [Ceratobasidium sp. 394]|nr:hypothetical protein FRC08_014400 [Ceratobasidium sp. 394]